MEGLGGQIISISVSKVINKTSITVVSYGDVSIPISDKFILISKTEENGIYTKTYIYEDTKDLELLIEREIEDIANDLYVKFLFRRLRKKGRIFHTRTKITGSPVALMYASHKPSLSRTTSLKDIIGYVGKFPIEEENMYLIEYGREVSGSGEMCGGEYRKVESKRVVVKDYSSFPKLNYIKCGGGKETITTSISEGSITVTYTTNAVCNVHRINKVTIRKIGGMKPIL